MIPILFYGFSFYLLIQAFRLMSVGFKAMEQNEKDLNRKPRAHPEMADVKEGDELLVCLLYTSDAARRSTLCRSRWSPYH